MFISLYIIVTSGSICTDHTWQQFDSFPKYGGNIHACHSDPDRGTSYLVVRCHWFIDSFAHWPFSYPSFTAFPLARGLTMKCFQIHLSSSNFLCVTQTKRIGSGTGAQTFPLNFCSPNFDPSCEIGRETNIGIFLASGIFCLLPLIKFWCFPKKEIFFLVKIPPKLFSFVSELQRFIIFNKKIVWSKFSDFF